MITLTHQDGTQTLVKVNPIAALDAWDIQHRYIDFCMSTDAIFRAKFTREILTHAVVCLEEVELPLKTDALINNHLRTWMGVKQVFEGVLSANGIDPETHAEKPNYWSNAGAEMAVSFVAEASKLMAPALGMLEQKAKE